MEQKGKSWLDLSLQYGARSRNVGLSILFISEFEERGVRKVTTGITGLWRPARGAQCEMVAGVVWFPVSAVLSVFLVFLCFPPPPFLFPPFFCPDRKI